MADSPVFAQRPGTRTVVQLPVLQDLDGSSVAIHVHVLTGVTDGPRLTLISGIHGNEWFSHEILRRVAAAVDPAEMTGSLAVVPVANPYAFRSVSRYSNDIQQVGYVNLNKAFLNDTASITGRVGAVLTEQVIQPSTHVVDFHPGPWGSAWGLGLYVDDVPESPVNRELALAFGAPYLQAANLSAYPNSVFTAAAAAGVATFGVELGGLGFGPETEERWLTQNVQGVHRMLGRLGMTRPDVPPAGVVRDVRILADLRASQGGMLMPVVGVDRLLTPVTAGELLATIESPVTFEPLEELRSPVDGVLLSVARRAPVHPYNFGFVIGQVME